MLRFMNGNRVTRESGSSVSGVWLRAGRPGHWVSIPGRGETNIPRASVSRPALGPNQPPVQWVPVGPFPGANARLGRYADHSPPSSAEIQND
jgi:hypothetical protein